jgi:malonyl-CoA decarboxylase
MISSGGKFVRPNSLRRSRWILCQSASSILAQKHTSELFGCQSVLLEFDFCWYRIGYQQQQRLTSTLDNHTRSIVAPSHMIFSSFSTNSSESGTGIPTIENEAKSSNNDNKLVISKFLHNNYSAIELCNDIVATLRYHRTNDQYNHRRFKHYQTELPSSDRHQLGRNVYKFCELYPKLPTLFGRPKLVDKKQPTLAERQAILNFLLTQTVVSDKSIIREIIEDVYKTTSSKTITTKSIQKLKQVCTPLCEDLIPLMLEMAAGLGLQCIIAIRQDLSLYKQYLKGVNRPTISEKSILDPTILLEALDILDDYLRQVVTTQFAPGFLDIKRITYQHSAAATIEAVARYEAVHPVKDLHDLRARLGLNRRVFGLFHPKLVLDHIPAVVLYVSLQSIIPSSMNQIHNQEREMNFENHSDDGFLESQSSAIVATFYSISKLQDGLSGVGLGEYLIKQSVKKLKQEIPTLETFVTLSPLPKFRKWLERLAFTSSSHSNFASSNNNISDTAMYSPNTVGFDNADIRQLATALECPINDALWNLIQRFDTMRPINPTTNNDNRNCVTKVGEEQVLANQQLDNALTERILTRLAAHYLVNEKYRGEPLDSVARFHTSNGAQVYRINFAADVSRKGWQQSFGIMVNYKYDIDLLQCYQDQYDADFTIVVHDNVKKQLKHDFVA